jgi:hypothetical protein
MAPEYLSPAYTSKKSRSEQADRGGGHEHRRIRRREPQGPGQQAGVLHQLEPRSRSHFGDFADSESPGARRLRLLQQRRRPLLRAQRGRARGRAAARPARPALVHRLRQGPRCSAPACTPSKRSTRSTSSCAPGQTDPAIQDAVLTHCEKMRYRFAILDAPEIIENGGVDKLPKPRDSKYGAYYFPWIEVYDPTRGNIFVPPSGHVAGIFARTDAERGVHKAPGERDRARRAGAQVQHHQGRAGHPQPQGDQLHPRVHQPGHPRLGRADHLERPRVALCQRAPPLQHGRGIDRGRHPVGGLRAQRPDAVEARTAEHHGVPAAGLARWRALRRQTPSRRSTSSATPRRTRPRSSTPASSSCEIGMCPVKPAEFVIFRIGQMPTGGDVSE